jgi:hypothetical protein
VAFPGSVFLRDMSTRLFMYGTTDIIVGGLKGTGNKVINTDFNARGEYQGGPDGCAFDFETGATGFEITGNYFYRSCSKYRLMLRGVLRFCCADCKSP